MSDLGAKLRRTAASASTGSFYLSDSGDDSSDDDLGSGSVGSALLLGGCDDDFSVASGASYNSFASARSASSLPIGADWRRGSDRRRRRNRSQQRERMGSGCSVDGMVQVSASSDDLVSLGSYRVEASSSISGRRSSMGHGKSKRGINGSRLSLVSLRSAGFDIRSSLVCHSSSAPGVLLIVAIFGMVFGIIFILTMIIGVANPLMGTKEKDELYVIDDKRVVYAVKKSLQSHKGRHWPISVREEETNFEVISHPAAVDRAGNSVHLAVPRFFLSSGESGDRILRIPLGDGRLLTPQIAGMIGTHSTEDGRRKDDINTRTIFVSIASFRDWRCRVTVESAFGRAKYPDRIRVGVVDQIDSDSDPSCDVAIRPCESYPSQALCKFHDHIDVYEMESSLAVGPTFARHLLSRMYRGEFYYLQIDAHTTFTQDWDVDIVAQFEQTKNDMAVLSTYLFGVEGNMQASTGLSIQQSRYLICNAYFKGFGRERRLHHDISDQPEGTARIRGSPQLHPYWSSEFSFSRGHFVLTVPYDPHIPMVEKHDEEISMAIRAFTHGFDFYAPERNICFRHAYAEGAPVPKSFLDNLSTYRGKQAIAISRLMNIIGMSTDTDWDDSEENMYGLGKVRSVAQFYTCFGVHVGERITERKLCDLVSTGAMHKHFLRHLRNDGMGIDYREIHFRFHELLRVHELENR
mmetsp:Transcript_10863/g.32151  ORF Transcript_10863/g.32151 Transcript_10863/m.32151 type:complete len:691 (-) Transcript_10863:598-2670(-)